MENKYVTFNENFFKGIEGITWYEKRGIYKISDTTFAEITIKTRGHADHYAGYEVKIHHKVNGVLNITFFGFKDYLEMIHNPKVGPYCDVWDDTDFGWYISVPKSTEPLVRAVMGLIELYK